jgi:uncharacterized membrane protein
MRKRLEPVILGLLLLFALSLRLELLSVRSLWIDEALSLDIASQSITRITAISRTSEPHPPGYYLALRLWLSFFGNNFVSARTLSILFGSLSVFLTWLLALRTGNRRVALAAAAVVAIHPFQVFASAEVRMYAMLTALGLASTLILILALEEERLWAWLLYGILIASVAYTSYYGFLLALAHSLAYVTAPRYSIFRLGPLAAALAALLSYAPWIPSLWSSITSNPVPWRPKPDAWYPIGIAITQTFGGYLFQTPTYHFSPPPGLSWIVLGSLAVILLGCGVRALLRAPDRNFVVAFSWVVPALTVIGLSVALNKQIAYYYHILYLQPYAAVLLLVGIRDVFKTVRGAVGLIIELACVAGILAIIAVGTHEMQRGTGEAYRFDVVGRWLAARYSKGDVLFYYAHVGKRVLRHYFDPGGPEIVVSLDPRRWTREDALVLLERGVAMLRDEQLRVWLVLTPPVPEGSVEDLARLLERKGFKPRDGLLLRGVRVVGLARDRRESVR